MLGRLLRSGTISGLRIVPPERRPGRRALAIAFVARNEARYIGEWARFHRLAGVEHFVCYDDGSTDDTVGALTRAVGAEAVTAIPWNQRLREARRGAELHNQVLAFAHACRNFGPDYRWLAFVDVDEFIVPRAAATIPEVLDRFPDAACLSLPWVMFGRSGHATAPDGPVLSHYTRRQADILAHPRVLKFKCIVDPCRVTTVRVHAFEVEGQAAGINDQGAAAPHVDRQKPMFVSTSALQLNHYYTRSDAELQAKIARGSNRSVAAARHRARVLRNVALIEADEVEDRTALEFLARHGRQEA
ncbi:MAG: glycosyltransferase family 92 protein [Shimia sp.]